MLFLGIDQSLTSTGLAIISPVSAKPVVLRTVVPGALRDGERLAFIRKEIAECLAGRSIVQAAMEGYSMGSTHNAFDLGEVGGLVKCLLAELKIPVTVVAPLALKKFCCNHVGADKQAMMLGVSKKWGVVISQDDEADAYVLAHVAAVYKTGISRYREELEVVHSLKKPDTTMLKPRRGRKGNTL